MAVGTDDLPTLHPVPGVRLGTVAAGIKTPGRKDLVLFELAQGTRCAAVFTRNAFCAAPVTLARENLQASGNAPRYLLVNTGNANAGTGESGLVAARACVASVAHHTGVDVSAILPFSTGVIGEPLPVIPIQDAVPSALVDLDEDG